MEAMGDDDAGALIPVFRAVTCRGVRRGLRLERVFWEGLSEMSRIEGRTIGDLIADMHEGPENGGSLSSRVRSLVARHFFERCHALERALLPDNIGAIVHAVPSPAFALSEERRILYYNGAFISFLQLRFTGAESADVFRRLALSLDTRIEEVIAQLRSAPGRPVTSGFALGISDRRVRGKLNLALIPNAQVPAVLATILQ